MFAPYFPPRRRVGAIRSFRFASELASRGWKVMVICLDTPGEELTDREKELLKNVSIRSIESPVDNTTSGNTKSSATPAGQGKLSAWFDRQFPIDTWYPLFRLKKKWILKQIRDFEPDVMWSTSDPWSSNLIMSQMKKETGIPWVADQRDPWTLCSVRFPNNGPIARFAARKAEHRIMTTADHIVFTARETTKKYTEAYPFISDKVSTIYNSFDPGMNTDDHPDEDRLDDLFRILFLGKFRPLSPATAVINVLSALRKNEPGMIDSVRVISYGALSADDRQKIAEAGLQENFEIRARVPNEQVPGEIADADIMLLSTEMDRNDIIPAKLIDYMPYNKPVLSLNESPEVDRILSGSGRGRQFGRDECEEAAYFIAEAVRGRRKGDAANESFKAPESSLRPFMIDHTADQLEEILNEVSVHG